MGDYSQGDIVKVAGYDNLFLVISNNAFISATGMLHVCPVLQNINEGPLHILIDSADPARGIAACEHIKLLDPRSRRISLKGRVRYSDLMNISDAIQGIFEYD